jgi:hypothetical protein
MKKSYSKPQIMFESFTMSTNIAAGCENIFGLYSRGVCGFPGDAPNSNIFNTKAGGDCRVEGNGASEYDDLCYHNPLETDNLFNS